MSMPPERRESVDPGSRAPIRWSVNERPVNGRGGEGRSAGSNVVPVSFRSMTGELQAVDIGAVAEPFGMAADNSQSLVLASASDPRANGHASHLPQPWVEACGG